MNIKFILQQFLRNIGFILFVFFLINFAKLLYRLFFSNFKINQFAFKKEYFMLNNEVVGDDIFTNLLKVSILAILLTFYMIHYRNKKEA